MHQRDGQTTQIAVALATGVLHHLMQTGDHAAASHPSAMVTAMGGNRKVMARLAGALKRSPEAGAAAEIWAALDTETVILVSIWEGIMCRVAALLCIRISWGLVASPLPCALACNSAVWRCCLAVAHRIR